MGQPVRNDGRRGRRLGDEQTPRPGRAACRPVLPEGPARWRVRRRGVPPRARVAELLRREPRDGGRGADRNRARQGVQGVLRCRPPAEPRDGRGANRRRIGAGDRPGALRGRTIRRKRPVAYGEPCGRGRADGRGDAAVRRAARENAIKPSARREGRGGEPDDWRAARACSGDRTCRGETAYKDAGFPGASCRGPAYTYPAWASGSSGMG